MMPAVGIVVVDRFELMRQARRAGVLSKRTPAVSLPAEDVFRHYRGFDGRPWPILEGRPFPTHGGLAAPSDWEAVSSYAAGLPNRDECDVVLLARQDGEMEDQPTSEWSLLGFDVGYFESEWSHFSVILNEVIFGVYGDLRMFAGRLNEHLLLSELGDCVGLIVERNRIAAEGKDVEQAAQIEPIAIFARQVVGSSCG